MSFGFFRKAAGVLALPFLAVAAAAQTGAGQPAAQPAPAAEAAQPSAQPGASGTQLDIPQNVSFVGTRQEPNVARATAIVNDEIITRSDIEQRTALFLAAQRVELPPEEMERLRAQILRNLIDETLQIQAAKEQEVTIERREIDRYYERFSQQFGHTPQSFTEYLRTIGASERTVKRQIEGELSWQQLQRRLPRVSVTDEEVNRFLTRLNASRGQYEYQVAEIFMYAQPETSAQVRQRMTQIVQQIRGGASFAAYARQFSEASTAPVGGDLGWLQAEQLPAELATVVQQMPVGAISDPIQLPDGFSVVALRDSRQVLVANPRDAVLSLMQMSIDMPAGSPEATVRQRADQLSTATQSMGGCGRAEETARTIGANLVANDSTRVRDLPPQLQQMLLSMNIGQATPVIGSVERMSVLILCGREDPQATPTPTAEIIADRMDEERMARQAQRLLRDLRRDAVIEYR